MSILSQQVVSTRPATQPERADAATPRALLRALILAGTRGAEPAAVTAALMRYWQEIRSANVMQRRWVGAELRAAVRRGETTSRAWLPVAVGEMDPELVRDSAPISVADGLAGLGRNDCEAVVRQRYPQMAGIMASLERWGLPVMTGTGSAIFLPMDSWERAVRAAREMKTLYNVRAVRGLDRSPVHEMLDADGP